MSGFPGLRPTCLFPFLVEPGVLSLWTILAAGTTTSWILWVLVNYQTWEWSCSPATHRSIECHLCGQYFSSSWGYCHEPSKRTCPTELTFDMERVEGRQGDGDGVRQLKTNRQIVQCAWWLRRVMENTKAEKEAWNVGFGAWHFKQRSHGRLEFGAKEVSHGNQHRKQQYKDPEAQECWVQEPQGGRHVCRAVSHEQDGKRGDGECLGPDQVSGCQLSSFYSKWDWKPLEGSV